MDARHRLLLLVWIRLNVVQIEASSWTITLPSTVKGLSGSCLVIPCSFDFPERGRKAAKFTGIWTDERGHIVSHTVASRVTHQYQDRTELLGDAAHKNCSFKIEPLQQSDRGPFYFRVEISNFNNFSYRDNGVTVETVAGQELYNVRLRFAGLEFDTWFKGELSAALSVKEVVEGQRVTALCSVTPVCPTSLPAFSWSHPGDANFQSLLFEDGQWKVTAALTFVPAGADHNTPLLCTVRYSGGRQQETSKLLKVKHAPVNVKVDYKADVREGEVVRLRCSGDAHPPVSGYEWYNETDAQVHQGGIYVIPNVSRHMGALYCSAVNTVGRGKSGPVRLSVLYSPEVKTVSSCSVQKDVVKCVCIAESKPPCTVHFTLSGTFLPGVHIERHGSVTIGTLQAEFGSSEFVSCLANNTEGSANRLLALPANGKMQNLYIAVTTGAAVFLVILLLTVVCFKKRRRTSNSSATPDDTKANKCEEELSERAAVKRKNRCYEDVHRRDAPVQDHVYGNMETEWDDAIYANV